MRIAVAGGGIGGLAAAVALRRVGANVTVYERNARGSAMGSGIGLWANALKVLEPLGLSERLTRGHIPITSGMLRDWRGRPLLYYPIGEFVPDAPIPFVAVRRPELHEVLLDAAGDGTVLFGRGVSTFAQDPAGVTVCLSDGTTSRFDLLVGADGIRSRLRENLFPGKDAYYTGWTVWQGVAPIRSAELPDPQTFQSLWSRDAAAMLMPMTAESVFWFISLRLPARADHDLSGADVEWDLARLAVDRTPKDGLTRTDLYEARPLRHWTSGRVTLLGDAAHAMRPTLGMGGCQAIEDAVALATSLARRPRPEGLADYEASRRRRANEMWWQSFMMPRLMNPQRPIPNWVRNLSLRSMPRAMAATQFRRMLTPTNASVTK
jgi:2-polyprenyl-6-methoxyphenol hydroxylase-like FAD-dependent oxidoreductase